ncbi:MAG: putative toxin-antitoxin system toxin component, PIN family [Gemmatimonadaceae bacterium]
MKVFLDTNVLVSAFTARGLCADLFRYLLAEHEVLTGEVNVVELRRVLKDRFGAAPTQVAAVEGLLRDQTIIGKPHVASPVRVRDPDDEWVVASAIAGAAGMLVTGDKDLLSVASQSPIAILAPREAWKRLRGELGAG